MLVCKTWREKEREDGGKGEGGYHLVNEYIYTHTTKWKCSHVYILRIYNSQVKWTYSLISL